VNLSDIHKKQLAQVFREVLKIGDEFLPPNDEWPVGVTNLTVELLEMVDEHGGIEELVDYLANKVDHVYLNRQHSDAIKLVWHVGEIAPLRGKLVINLIGLDMAKNLKFTERVIEALRIK